jgi:hypothetical protein
MQKIINNKYRYLVLVPIVINFLINIFDSEVIIPIKIVNPYTLVATVLLFLFLLQLGSAIQKIFQLNTISISIVIYLTSIFIFDFLSLFISQVFTFHQNFILMNIIWIIIFLKNKNTRINLLLSTVALFALNVFNLNFRSLLDKNKNLTGDVEMYFFPQAKQIFENSYFYSITNPITEGYPQFISYLHSSLFKIGFIKSEIFEYFSQTTTIFFLLMILFFLELNISTLNKFALSIIYFSLIMNSEWLSYLFSNSLMSESIASYFFVVILKSLLDHIEQKNQFIILLFFSGWMIFSKQFISTLILLTLLYLCIYKKSFKYFVTAFLPFLINEIAYLFHFKNIVKDHHYTQIDIRDTLFDLFLLRDLDIYNIGTIFNNLLLDKPFSLVFFTALIFSVCQLFFIDTNRQVSLIYFLIFIINTSLVVILYISAWRNMELESPIRYFLTLVGLYFLIIFRENESKVI